VVHGPRPRRHAAVEGHLPGDVAERSFSQTSIDDDDTASRRSRSRRGGIRIGVQSVEDPGNRVVERRHQMRSLHGAEERHGKRDDEPAKRVT
jgi:hypothetical protein